MAYDPVGAMGGLFAPAFIYGNPQAEAAASAWNTAHLQTPPPPDHPFTPGAASPAAPNPAAARDTIAQSLMPPTNIGDFGYSGYYGGG
jgi:hypothetical protein